jgi:hypothetical protein
VSVLVLEAGAANLNDPEIGVVLVFNLSTGILTLALCAEIPAIYGSQLGKPQYDWSFLSVSAPYLIPPCSNLGQGAPSECKWEAY